MAPERLAEARAPRPPGASSMEQQRHGQHADAARANCVRAKNASASPSTASTSLRRDGVAIVLVHPEQRPEERRIAGDLGEEDGRVEDPRSADR